MTLSRPIPIDPSARLRSDLAALSEAAATINEAMPRVLSALLEMVDELRREQARPLVVDLERAAAMLGGISTRTVRRMIDAGELVAVPVPGHTMVATASIDTYVAGKGR